MSNSTAISVLLLDGDPDGRRLAHFGMELPKVHAFPKGQLKNVASEIGRPGVYLVYGFDALLGKNKVYIGESLNVANRLQFHAANANGTKVFWENTVVLVSQTDNLTKAHVGYIEAKLISDALRNTDWKVTNDKLTNGIPPKATVLPQADTINMDKFISQTKTLVRMLGCDVFKANTGPLLNEAMTTDNPTVSPEFIFSGKGFDAKAVVLAVSGEWIVKAHSTAKLNAQAHLSDGIKKLRQQLQEAGKLIETEGQLVFQEDCSFKSASTAASVVCGSAKDGRNKAWKLAEGTTYSEWELAQTGPLPAGTTI